VVVLDMDSTLIDAETINELAYEAGVGKEVAEITRMAMEGKIDYREALKRRVKMLEGLSVNRAKKAVERMPYMDGAHELVSYLKSKNLMVVMVSCGFSIATD
jgi:phosphoserine phosphatase